MPKGVYFPILLAAILADVSASTSAIQGFPTEDSIETFGHFGCVVPDSYRVQLHINTPFVEPEKLTSPHYNGTVRMRFRVACNVKDVHVHSNNTNMMFRNVMLHSVGDPPAAPIAQTVIDDVVRFEFPLQLRQGYWYDLVVDFAGNFSFDGQGVVYNYNASANSPKCQPVASVTTLFERRNARRFFPCIDHPALKANFEFCVDAPNQKDVVFASNEGQIPKLQYQDPMSCFKNTQKLPTYLFAFAALYNYQKMSSKSSFPVKVYYACDTERNHSVAIIDKTRRYVNFVQNYFDQKFPLEGLSFVFHPMPNDVSGMENHGLISFNSRNILRLSPSAFDKLVVLQLIHHYTGNTIGLKCWWEVGIMKGLSTYLGIVIADTALGIPQDKGLYTLQETGNAFGGNLAPIVPQHNNVTDTMKLCNHKPALIFSTIRKMLFRKQFLAFVRNMVGHRNALSPGFKDWVRALNEISPDASDTFKTYMEGTGFPVIKVAKGRKRGGIILAQHMFNGTHVTSTFHSPLPLVVRSPNSAVLYQNVSIEDPIGLRVHGSEMNNSWAMVDPTGMFYKVVYDQHGYKAVLDCLKTRTRERGRLDIGCPSEKQVAVMMRDLEWWADVSGQKQKFSSLLRKLHLATKMLS